MANVAVVYVSRYGSTQQYAKWLAEELRCDMLKRRKVRVHQLEGYETIIYGGPLYAGGVPGVKLLRKNIETLGNKNLIVFTCGIADPTNEKNRRHIRDRLSDTLTASVTL